jgi:hypothetical protein
MKSKDIQGLHKDLIRICDQIGILPHERSRLITDRKEMQNLLLNHPHTHKSGNPKADKRVGGFGQCCFSLRTVFVNKACRKSYYLCLTDGEWIVLVSVTHCIAMNSYLNTN